MRILPHNLFKIASSACLIGCLMLLTCTAASAELMSSVENGPFTSDRIDVVSQQIVLLKNRYHQAERELNVLQKSNQNIPLATLEAASKNFLDKAALDIAVAKSNLESISIELADARQTVSWLKKNVQEIENQLNVLNVFGARIAKSEMLNDAQLRSDLSFQQRLLSLENVRVQFLNNLEDDAGAILQIRKEQLSKLSSQLKSQRLLRMKQQEVREELIYQEQQNQWLERLSALYANLAKTNPVIAKEKYAELEDEIFSASEHANYAYAQSLIARYRDQVQQLRMVVLKSSSIGQLNELSEQAQLLGKQIEKLGSVLSQRMTVLGTHAVMGAQQKLAGNHSEGSRQDLQNLQAKYIESQAQLKKLDDRVVTFRLALAQALQVELSSRQGFPSFDAKTMLNIGKEILLVPALGFEVMKSLAVTLASNVKAAGPVIWGMFVFAQVLLALIFIFANRLTQHLLQRPSAWREKINSKWLSLKWLEHHFIDLYLLLNVLSTMFIFNVPFTNYIFFVYLAAVWFIFKAIIVTARICLVETTSHTAGKDMRLYGRLKWIFAVGGVTTAAAAFIYQLPLIYELKTLSDRLFLLFMMLVSIMLLRFWDVVPNLILSHMDKRHPYFEKSIRILGVLIPLLMLGNSAIGMLGYVNLVMSVSWYEGVFLCVFIAYLVLRGLLTDSVEQLSQVVIKHSSNGWLLTEAFLKPLDRILKIFLFLAAGSVLFLLYGWDKQSPIVERLNGLLHYQLANVLNTTITPMRMLSLIVVVSVFYWTAKWMREFVYRFLTGRTSDMGIRNSMAILSQYAVIVVGIFLSLQVLGIDPRVLAAVTTALAFGVGLGLRDLANNFFCGFLILLERPLRVGDIIEVNDVEGEVINIGSRAVTVMTWDNTALVVPNTEIFNKSFTNLTARDNVVRCIVRIKISRQDNPHQVQALIHQVISASKFILSEPAPEVFLKEMNDLLLHFELRYFVNIRMVKSRTMVASNLLMAIWDAFAEHGIRPPYPQQEIFIRNEQTPEGKIVSVSKLEEVIN